MEDIAQYGIHRVLAAVYGGKVDATRREASTEEVHAELVRMFSPTRQYVLEDMEAEGLSAYDRCKCFAFMPFALVILVFMGHVCIFWVC